MPAIRWFTVYLALALASSPAQGAENLALIIANQNYKDFGDARDAFDATLANDALRAADFDLKIIRNLNRNCLARVPQASRNQRNRCTIRPQLLRRAHSFLVAHVP